MRRALPVDRLPLWRKERGFSVAIGPELLTLMEQARGYQAKAVAFPEALDELSAMPMERIDEDVIRTHLYQSLPLNDLLSWLCEHYGHYHDVTMLRLYHKPIRLPDIAAAPNPEETRMTLKQVAIRLHSHRMDTHEH